MPRIRKPSKTTGDQPAAALFGSPATVADAPSGASPVLYLWDIAALLGITPEALQVKINAGRLPAPSSVDRLGPAWERATIESWITLGGASL